MKSNSVIPAAVVGGRGEFRRRCVGELFMGGPLVARLRHQSQPDPSAVRLCGSTPLPGVLRASRRSCTPLLRRGWRLSNSGHGAEGRYTAGTGTQAAVGVIRGSDISPGSVPGCRNSTTPLHPYQRGPRLSSFQRRVLIPSLVFHPLPQLGGQIMEADIEGWEGRGLMKRRRAGEVVPSGPEGKPQGAVLHFL
ncbi:hypothetical protein E2C01_040749 [Portunus trituberculatus]|uniref:Uncharacterized protein n=1 Tax=Portunus trituberculatus TaxID=210409 RepID=A0A5B7FNF8_PORTR|nr:hypothetical protein [Portunus trituberculatus]